MVPFSSAGKISPPAICCGTTPSFAQHLAWESTDAEFQSLEVINGVDLLAEPATHLAAGIASHERGAR